MYRGAETAAEFGRDVPLLEMDVTLREETLA